MLRVDKLIPEVMQHYPNEPVNAMKYLIEQYDIDTLTASHLVSVIWSHLDMQNPIYQDYVWWLIVSKECA